MAASKNLYDGCLSCVKSSSSEKQFQLERVVGLESQYPRMENEFVANISQDETLFLEKSFGCGLCDEKLDTDKEFLEHCFGHRYSLPDDLLRAMC